MPRRTRVEPFVQDDETEERLDYPNKSTCCVKFIMFFMNITFWFASVLVLVIGIYAMRAKEELYGKLSNEIGSYATDPAIILMTIGIIIFIISFAGCLGSLRENVCLLKVYSYMLGFILLLEITAGVVCYYYQEEVKTKMEAGFRKMIVRYRDDPDLQTLMDVLQSELACCGATSYTDWNDNIYFNCSSPGVEACGVPFSCCTKKSRGTGDSVNTQCGYHVRSLNETELKNTISLQGCIKGVQNWFMANMMLLAGIGGGLVLLQIMSYCLAGKLTSDIKNIIEKKKQLSDRSVKRQPAVSTNPESRITVT